MKAMIISLCLFLGMLFLLGGCPNLSTDPPVSEPSLSSEKAITSFSVPAAGATGTISEADQAIALTVPFNTDVSALVATFTSTGQTVTVGSVIQASGVTANNFIGPVIYTVAAEDGTTRDYVVTVTVASSSAKALTAFSFPSIVATGTVNETDHAVGVMVPYGTDVTALVADFTTTGQAVKVGEAVQGSGTTPNNFSSLVTYTVVAADGSTQDYVVTVAVALNPAKAFTAFSFSAVGATGYVLEIDHTIAVTVPYGTNVTALVATFMTTGQTVKVGSAVQTSGVTPNNFSSPVTYTVVAADGSTQDYAVTVRSEPAPQMVIRTEWASVIPSGSSVRLSPVYSSQTCTQTFRVYNDGPFGSNLRLTGAQLVGDGNNFLLDNFPSAPIASGHYASFTVKFTPGIGVRLYTTSLSISSNDSAHNPYTYTLDGDMYYRTFDAHGITGTGAGQFLGPVAVAYNPVNSRVYVADRMRHKVLVFDAACNFLLEFGPPSGNGCLASPEHLALDSAGNVYVASSAMALDPGFHYVQKFAMDGTWITGWGSKGPNDGQFNIPTGIAVGPGNEVYVSDAYNNRVQVFSSSGTYLRKWWLSAPWGVAPFTSGWMLVCTADYGDIMACKTDGTSQVLFGSGGAHIAVDGSSDVFCTLADRIKITDYSGTVKGSLSWTGLLAKQIEGMAYGSNGYLYFVNCNWGDPAIDGNNLLVRVQKYTPVP